MKIAYLRSEKVSHKACPAFFFPFSRFAVSIEAMLKRLENLRLAGSIRRSRRAALKLEKIGVKATRDAEVMTSVNKIMRPAAPDEPCYLCTQYTICLLNYIMI